MEDDEDDHHALLEPPTTTTSSTLWRHASTSALATTTTTLSAVPIKRSESSNSLGGITAVEDSSLMKRAYKKCHNPLHTAGLLDAYYTLHTGSTSEPEFYKSEMIPNTTNPTFRSMTIPFDSWMNWHDAASSLVIVRVWTRHSIPESAGQHTEPMLGYQAEETKHEEEGFQLLIEWQVDLNALSWLGKKVIANRLTKKGKKKLNEL